MDYMENFEEAEKIDKLRSKMLKYILYKKRTEQEIRQKFCEEDENAVEDAIEYFKELNYINDVQRSVQEFINLKSLSIKEITYKLCQKGVNKKIVDEYVRKHEDELVEYEINSAKKIWQKKVQSSDENTVKDFLYKKGYRQDVIRELEK